MKLQIKIKNVQQLKEVEFSIDFENTGLVCITGKNGAGKTTLIKCIRNITNADTFQKTSSDDIFSNESLIEYHFKGVKIVFAYDKEIKSLNSKDLIPRFLRTNIAVELPIPHGERFNFFQSISNADSDIRRAVSLKQYVQPKEAVEFLKDIYPHSSFDRLVEITVKKSNYYCILQEGVRYLREDYFSSGEYFLLSLYRRIVKGKGIIVIDEIDISLDAAAQVRLMEKLREFGKKYKIGFIFTTHSLAMMQTLKAHELFHMEKDRETHKSEIKQVSYNYIKSVLFGFSGWDKYILTEDDVLKDFIIHIINTYCGPVFYQYKIIYIGGGTNTTNLMKRNSSEQFFAAKENVICILDGDQKKLRHSKSPSVYCIPMESVEKGFLEKCLFDSAPTNFSLSKILNDDLGSLRRYLNNSSNANNNKAGDHIKIRLGFLMRVKAALLSIFRRLPYSRNLSAQTDKIVSTEKEYKTASKKLFAYLIKEKIHSRRDIFEILCATNVNEIKLLAKELRTFLNSEEKTESALSHAKDAST